MLRDGRFSSFCCGLFTICSLQIDAILHQLEERRDTLTKQLLELNVNDSSADGDAHSAMTNGVNGSEPEPAFSAIDRNDKKPVA